VLAAMQATALIANPGAASVLTTMAHLYFAARVGALVRISDGA
jgi:hypothetical protein